MVSGCVHPAEEAKSSGVEYGLCENRQIKIKEEIVTFSPNNRILRINVDQIPFIVPGIYLSSSVHDSIYLPCIKTSSIKNGAIIVIGNGQGLSGRSCFQFNVVHNICFVDQVNC